VVDVRGKHADVSIDREVCAIAVREAGAPTVVQDDREMACQLLIKGSDRRHVPRHFEVTERGRHGNQRPVAEDRVGTRIPSEVMKKRVCRSTLPD
jgi:hypothetical protein